MLGQALTYAVWPAPVAGLLCGVIRFAARSCQCVPCAGCRGGTKGRPNPSEEAASRRVAWAQKTAAPEPSEPQIELQVGTNL